MERIPAPSAVAVAPSQVPLPGISGAFRAALLPILLGAVTAPAVHTVAQDPVQQEKKEEKERRVCEVYAGLPQASESALIAHLNDDAFLIRSSAEEELMTRVKHLTYKEGRTDLLRLVDIPHSTEREIVWRGQSLGKATTEQCRRLSMLFRDIDTMESHSLHVGTQCTLPKSTMKLGEALDHLSRQIGRPVKVLHKPEHLETEVTFKTKGSLWEIVQSARLPGNQRLSVCYSTKSSVDLLVVGSGYSTEAINEGVIASCYESHFVNFLMEPKAQCLSLNLKGMTMQRQGEKQVKDVLPKQPKKTDWSQNFQAYLPYARYKGETATLTITVEITYDRVRKYTVEDVTKPAEFLSSASLFKYLAVTPSTDDPEVIEVLTENIAPRMSYQSMDIQGEDLKGSPIYSHGSTTTGEARAWRMEKGKMPARLHFYVQDGKAKEHLQTIEKTFVLRDVPLRQMIIPGTR